MEQINGITYGYSSKHGDLRSPRAIQSQDKLYELGNNWICIAITNYQENRDATSINFNWQTSPTDRDIEAAVKYAHDHNVKVCFKPMVDSKDWTWRALIGHPETNADDMDLKWQLWSNSYMDYICYYAELAQELGIEMFCIGCEMVGMEKEDGWWRCLIKKVRAVYSGIVVYNTQHHHEDKCTWFEDLDFIGTSAYFPVGDAGHTKEAMAGEWQKEKTRLDQISESTGKKYIFMEVGCRSVKNHASSPWDYGSIPLPFDEDEQANFFDSLLETFNNTEQFAGMFIWDWSTILPYNTREEATLDTGYDIHLKKAEDVIRSYFQRK